MQIHANQCNNAIIWLYKIQLLCFGRAYVSATSNKCRRKKFYTGRIIAQIASDNALTLELKVNVVCTLEILVC